MSLMSKGDNTISLVINTKNEESNIKDCIESARQIADEIIVVDMASTDKTAEIAKKCGAEVFPVPDYGYVEPARNFALSKPKSKWTLVLDADERLTKTLRAKILKLVKEDKFDGYKIPFKNKFFGTWIRHSMWWPDYHIRLFKTGYLDWPKGVHHDVSFKGTLSELEPIEENAIVHNNIADIREMIEMVDHYSGVEAVFAGKKNPTAKDLVEYLDHEFKWRFLEHKGYLDGIHGFILGKFMNIYRFLEFAKYWEKQKYKKMFTPEQLKEAAESAYSLDREKDALIKRLKEDLEKIQSAKFYRIWQGYCNLRDKLFRK